jgi:phosphoribosylformylglycinamidine cyclo-ligase
MKKLTYKQAGVDIEKATAFKKRIKGLVRKSFTAKVLKDIGGFGSFFCFPKEQYQEPVLVSSTDGVGTKLKIAVLTNKHDTVGIDAVAMNVNDILCTGASPLFFVDYIACGKLEPGVLYDLVKGLTIGCSQAGCPLIGGETAEMPGMYGQGEYDIAGFCVGVVEKKNIIDGSAIAPGDKVIGLASNGIHSNGYSLVRKVFSPQEQRRLSAELLKPTRIYVKPVLSLLKTLNTKHKTIRGIAHITGGAFYDKIARILPAKVDVVIKEGSWPVPKIFKLLQNKGNIADKEMFHTFNMGVGMVLIVAAQSAEKISSSLLKFNLRSWVIGEVVAGRKTVFID